MHQAFLERMQQSSGYGRASEPPQQQTAPGTGSRLPFQPLGGLQTVQAQAEEALRRVGAMENTIGEVNQRLDDWAEVTRTGIADLRSELGSVKLEQRFSATLRSTGGESNYGSQAVTPSIGFANSQSPKEAARSDGKELGEELKKRLELYDQKLTDMQHEQMTETSSMKGRLEAALRESDQQMSRADELQALLKEEQGRRALLFARLEAVEASCQDLRNGQHELASLPEATERILKGEIQKEMEQVRDELTMSRSVSEQHSLTVSRAEKSAAELSQRVDGLDSRLRDFHQEQASETASLRGRLEAAVRECDRQVANADQLTSLFQEEQTRSGMLQSRLEQLEQGGAGSIVQEHRKLLARLDALEVSCKAAMGSTNQSGIAAEDSANLRSEMAQEIASLRDELERSKMESASSMLQIEATSLDLARKQEESDRKLLELKQDHLSETVALRGRIEEAIGDNHAQQASMGGFASQANESDARRSAEVNTLTSRIDRLEKRALSVGHKSSSEEAFANSGNFAARLQAIEEFSQQMCMEVDRSDERLKVLEKRKAMEDTVAVPPVSASPEALSELRASVMSSSQDMGKLAKELATMREEHDQAISSLGSLTELVARTAASGIQRSEERIAADLTGKRQEFERSVALQKEQMEREAKAILAEVKNIASSMALQGGSLAAPVQGGSAKSDDGNDSRVEAALRRIEAVGRELRAEASAQSEAAEARVASVEAAFGSDLKRLRGMLSTCVSQLESMQVELSQLELQRLGPRLAEVEAKLSGKAKADLASNHSLAEESTEASRSRPISNDPRDLSRLKWVSAFQKATSPNAERKPQTDTVRQGLKDKLSGIASSVHQVLGALDGINDADVNDGATVVSGVSGSSTFGSSQQGATRPGGVGEDNKTHSLTDLASSLGQRNRLSRSPNALEAEVDDSRGRAMAAPTSPRNRDPAGKLLADEVPGAQSPMHGGGGCRTIPGSGLAGLVANATGSSRPAMPGLSRAAFTAPQSAGQSRERSPDGVDRSSLSITRSSVNDGLSRTGIGAVDRSRPLASQSHLGQSARSPATGAAAASRGAPPGGAMRTTSPQGLAPSGTVQFQRPQLQQRPSIGISSSQAPASAARTGAVPRGAGIHQVGRRGPL